MTKVSNAIRSHIGDASADHVLACLYIARSDVSIVVRQSALQIWKSIVTNTPRTLMDIMRVLLSLLIEKLSDGHADDDEDEEDFRGRGRGHADADDDDDDEENETAAIAEGDEVRVVAGRSLGDLVMKLGDKVRFLDFILRQHIFNALLM